MKRLLAMLVILSQLSACASYETVQQDPSAEAVQQQVAQLSGWVKGTDEAEFRQGKTWDRMQNYQSLEHDGTWQFFNAWNQATDARLGFLFHDGRLASIVTEDDAQHLVNCLVSSNLSGRHWVTQGLGSYGAWMEAHTLVGNPQALATHGTVNVYVHNSKRDQALRAKGAPTAEDVGYFIAYLPILIIGLPFYLARDKQPEQVQEFRSNVLEDFENTLEAGQLAPDHVLSPDSSFDLGDMHVMQFEYGDFAYGTRAGKVVMVEAPVVKDMGERMHSYDPGSWDRLMSEQAEQDCAGMRGHR